MASQLLLATGASYLTIKLTASNSVYSSKDDSPSVPYPGFSPNFPAPYPKRPASTYGGTDSSEPAATALEDLPVAPKPRKVMFFAAGSGAVFLSYGCVTDGSLSSLRNSRDQNDSERDCYPRVPRIVDACHQERRARYVGRQWLIPRQGMFITNLNVFLSLSITLQEGPFVHIASCVGNVSCSRPPTSRTSR